MSFLTLVAEATQDETVRRTLWEWLLMVCGGITVVSGAGVIVWKVAVKPHFLEFVRRAAEVHQSVTVNGGKNNPPTLLDKVHETSTQLSALAQAVKSTDERTKDLGDKVDLLSELTQDTRDDFKKHVDAGENYLGTVVVELGKQGIELPRPDTD